jgi:hypothetical protein
MKERFRRISQSAGGVLVLTVVAALAMAGGFIGGLNIRISDPVVQAGIVGAAAGIAGGLVGASIGAWTSRRVADQTLTDARWARHEARMDARNAKFLEDRRKAIMDLLVAGERAIELAVDVGQRGPASRDYHLAKPEGPSIAQAYAVVSLLAPDLAIGPAAPYRDAVHRAVRSCVEWAHEAGRTDAEGDRPTAMPEEVKDAVEEASRTRSVFIATAVQHLGVTDYTGTKLVKLIIEDKGMEWIRAAMVGAVRDQASFDDLLASVSEELANDRRSKTRGPLR